MPFELPESWVWAYGYERLNPIENRKPIGEMFRYIDINSIDNKRHVIADARHLTTARATHSRPPPRGYGATA
ncbi:MAG: hypothetical protein LBG96_13145 [Tannerella sp.]|nr:hypothetical protein [Tannerella sp.]